MALWRNWQYALDLKSRVPKGACGFDSHQGYTICGYGGMVDTLALEARAHLGMRVRVSLSVQIASVTQWFSSASFTRKKSGVRTPPDALKDSFSKQKLVKNSHLKCERSGSNPQNITILFLA